MEIQSNFSLKKYNTFGIEAKAKQFVAVHSTEELRELLDLVSLPGEDDNDFTTVAGMVIAHFGRIPHSGEHFDWQGWRIEVVDLDGARIDKLLIARALIAVSEAD